MKKILAIALAVCLVFSLCACGKQETPAPTAAVQTPQATTTTTQSDPSSAEAQTNLIYQNLGTIRADEAGRSFWYTVTDLDHNGRLEFTAAITEGTSNVTTARMYEVNSAFTGLDPVGLGLTGEQSMPEIIVKTADVYKDSNNLYHYIFDDTNSNALATGGHYLTKVALTLNNQTVELKNIAYQDVTYENGVTVYSFYDSTGNAVDPATFDIDKEADNVYKGATKSQVNLDWFSLSEVVNSSRLLTSYNVFSGGQAPQPGATTPTPAPTIQVVPTATLKITKNPTSEYVKEGGSCSFIAQAIGYNSMKWQLVSPNGVVVDAANMSQFLSSGLYIYGTNQQTLTLANIPLEMNGWSVQAVFTGDTESATTQRATVYVSAAPTPVYVTISLSPSSGYAFTNSYNVVNVYSSNGKPIHVECIQDGNSGPYYSETISSGSSFPIEGVSGQRVGVTVYASCGDSQVNAYYIVDCTPVTPTTTTKNGTVETLNTEGGGYYVGVQFDDGTYGNYDITYLVSNPPQPGTRCSVTFASDGITVISFSFN